MPLKQLTTSQDQNSIDKKVGKISENTIDLLRGTALKKLRRRNEINNIKTIINQKDRKKDGNILKAKESNVCLTHKHYLQILDNVNQKI